MVDKKQRVWQDPEVEYNSNMPASSDLFPSATIWFLKVSQLPKIMPSHGGTGGPNQSLWGHLSSLQSTSVIQTPVTTAHEMKLHRADTHLRGPPCARLYCRMMPDVEDNIVLFLFFLQHWVR